MRTWIEHLITHEGAYNDFIEWADGIDTQLKKDLQKAVIGNKMVEARNIASEITVYNNIKRSIKSERQEHLSINNRVT